MDKPLEPENKAKAPEEECFCFDKWPLDYMKHEEHKKGEVLFRMGDKADKMYYIKKGSIKLTEINKIIKEGSVIGEMGIFSPFKQRTASAVCEEDLEAYTMGRDEVIKLFNSDPTMAINLIQLSIRRFIENLKAETVAKERIASELRIAAEIQLSLLPGKFPPFPDRREFDIFAIMDPAKEVGGDLYDFFFVDKNRFCFIIGDVSGKGVPAALFMATSKTLLKSEALRGLSADEVLCRVNNTLCPDNHSCMFVTVFCVIVDLETGELQFCNGGHNPPLISTGGGDYEFIDIHEGFVIGVMENTKYVSKKMCLKPGDVVCLYTDGVTEAMSPKSELFSEERLKASLAILKDKKIEDIIHGVRKEIIEFAEGADQSDDITMLAFKYKGK